MRLILAITVGNALGILLAKATMHMLRRAYHRFNVWRYRPKALRK